MTAEELSAIIVGRPAAEPVIRGKCGARDMVAINGERLLADLKYLRSFGACGTGVVRRSLSPVDLEARRWLVSRMTEAGLEAEIDGLGTVFGRSKKPGPALLIGSHSDTQPTGGWLDGALGVIYGLEVARTLAEDPAGHDSAVEVAAWIDEEGTFFSCLGSTAFCGEMPEEALERARNAEGQTLGAAIEAAGLAGRPRASLDPARYRGYLEAHIEQGPYLEEEGNSIGVVTSIVGIRNFDITFEGQQNHAGTTPMKRRRDAVQALIALSQRLNQAFEAQAGPRSVWTTGRIDVEPGAPSIVPGRTSMIFQFRDAEEERLEALEALTRDLVSEADRAGPVRVSIEPRSDHTKPAVMDAGLQAHIAEAAEIHAAKSWVRMPSAAGHDAQILARHIPSAMLFIPSIGGVSHDFSEDTAEEDIVLGCQVLATAAASILKQL